MRKFTKFVENFICDKCGTTVDGNGFTNHCPNCLFSKHVDINPGDRRCNCHGLMEPINLIQKNGNFVLIHRCIKCGFNRKNKVSENDNRILLAKLSSSISAAYSNQYLILDK